jgi:hypothetical protein
MRADEGGARSRLGALWEELASVEGFMEGASIFSESDEDRAYFVNGTQVANADGDKLGLRLTRQVISEHRQRLKLELSVDLRRSGSDWIIVEVDTAADCDLVMELAPLAARAHWPTGGGALKPPPEGAELARRRKFH